VTVRVGPATSPSAVRCRQFGIPILERHHYAETNSMHSKTLLVCFD